MIWTLSLYIFFLAWLTSKLDVYSFMPSIDVKLILFIEKNCIQFLNYYIKHIFSRKGYFIVHISRKGYLGIFQTANWLRNKNEIFIEASSLLNPNLKNSSLGFIRMVFSGNQLYINLCNVTIGYEFQSIIVAQFWYYSISILSIISNTFMITLLSSEHSMWKM